MPLVTAIPKGLQNGNIITEFTDTTNLSAVTYTYPTQQTSLVIENSGEKDIFVTVGSYTDQLIQADKKWKVDTPFTSFSIKSDVNSQEFIATATFDSEEDLASLTVKLAENSSQLSEKDTEIFNLMRLLYTGNSVIKDNLFLWLDGADFTSGTWNDKSGNGYNMTMTGCSSDAAGGVVFNGTSDYGQIGDNTDLKLPYNWTIELNVKAASNLVDKFPLSKGTASTLDFAMLYGWSSGKYELYSDRISAMRADTTISANDGNFHLISFTYDGKFIRCYCDGILTFKTTKTFTMLNSTNPLLLGRDSPTGSIYTPMTVKSLRIYNRALADLEIRHNYEAETGLKVTKTSYTFSNAVSGVSTVVYLPKSYKDIVKNKYVVFIHGASGVATDIASTSQCGEMLAKFLADGFVIIATTGTSNSSWGNAQSATDLQNLINYYSGIYNLADKPYLFLQSMGGLVGLNAIMHGAITPKAIAAVFPVTNLANMYGTSFKNSIQTAYGITDDTQYAAKTAGYDPNLAEFSLFKPYPFYILASNGDTTVNTAQNRDLFKQKLQTAGGNITTVDTIGNHGDLSNYKADNIVNFFNSY